MVKIISWQELKAIQFYDLLVRYEGNVKTSRGYPVFAHNPEPRP